MGNSGWFPRHYNTDGSRNVYCRQCRRLVGSLSSGQAGFGSVSACAICDAANNDTELSPEIQDALTGNVRLQSGFMAPRNSILPDAKDIPPDPLTGKDGKEGMGSYWSRVIKAVVFGVVDGVKAAKQEPLSKKVAKERKRSRVFAIEDNEIHAEPQSTEGVPDLDLRSLNEKF